MSLLQIAQEYIEIGFRIEEYVKNTQIEKKDFISLEIDKLIEAYNVLIKLKDFSRSKDIEITITGLQKILADMGALKTYKKKAFSVMRINPDKYLTQYLIKGKHKEGNYGLTYTARPENFNSFITDKYGLSSNDIHKLLYEVLLIKTYGMNKKEYAEIQIKILIEKQFRSFNSLGTKQLKYVAIVLPDTILNIPLKHLDESERYDIYFKPNINSKANVYTNLTVEDIDLLFSHEHNNIEPLI